MVFFVQKHPIISCQGKKLEELWMSGISMEVEEHVES